MTTSASWSAACSVSAANLAADICGVTVGVLATDLARGKEIDCENAEQFVTITQ